MRPRIASLLALGLLAAGCGAADSGTHTATHPATNPGTHTATHPGIQPASGSGSRSHSATVITVNAPPPSPARPHRPPAPDPGTLPQTDARPSAGAPAFAAEMRALWRAIRTGAPAAGRGAFFPEGAYVQVKAVADPHGDFRARLLGGYVLDIAAAHALITARPGPAHLVRVAVPASYAHWVPPGVCANRVGYWEVPNARVVYIQAGTVRSFGIASMISWRGAWYVVHLGAVLRSGSAGAVDDPEIGPGVSAPSSTC